MADRKIANVGLFSLKEDVTIEEERSWALLGSFRWNPSICEPEWTDKPDTEADALWLKRDVISNA